MGTMRKIMKKKIFRTSLLKKNDNGNYDEDDNSFKPKLLSSNSEDDNVRHDYLFLSFFVFVLWGPFVETDSRLVINPLDDKNTSKGVGTRKETRKKDRDEKITDSTVDTYVTRGITMDQRTEIQNLNVC